MSNFDRFRNKNLNKIVSTTKVNSDFVLKGYPTVEITFANGETQCVSLVNKQEKDMAYVYVKECEPLQVGTIFFCKNVTFLLTEEIMIVKDVHFKKYIALLCNVDLGNGEWGYFKGPQKSYINLSLKDDIAVSMQKPILVARQGFLKTDDVIEIKGRPWAIIESDIASSDYVGYYSLEATTKPKEDNTPVVPQSEPSLPQENILTGGQKVVLTTESGYFKSSPTVNKLNITFTSAEFEVPFGIKELAVEVKENGQIKKIKYIIR